MNFPAGASLNASLLAARMEHPASPAPLLALTTALAQGDDAVWAQFHREYGPRMFRQLLAATRGDHDLASEALQQAYLRIARHARPCDAEPMFLAWLRVVARSALSDCRRRRVSFWQLLRRRYEDPADIDGCDADEERLQAALDRALATLELADRELLTAKYLSGLSVRALAEKLSASPKAIESRLTRARAELRKHLHACLADHE